MCARVRVCVCGSIMMKQNTMNLSQESAPFFARSRVLFWPPSDPRACLPYPVPPAAAKLFAIVVIYSCCCCYCFYCLLFVVVVVVVHTRTHTPTRNSLPRNTHKRNSLPGTHVHTHAHPTPTRNSLSRTVCTPPPPTHTHTHTRNSRTVCTLDAKLSDARVSVTSLWSGLACTIITHLLSPPAIIVSE